MCGFVVCLRLIRQSRGRGQKIRLETTYWFTAWLFCARLLSMDGCAWAQACHSNCPRLVIQCISLAYRFGSAEALQHSSQAALVQHSRSGYL